MKYLFSFVLSVLLIACGGGENTLQTTEQATIPDFKSEKILIDLKFPKYQDSVVMDIMADVGLCYFEPDTTLPDSVRQLPCDYRVFRVFMNHADNHWEDGFLVELRGGIITETFRVLNISKIDNKYAVTNEMTGELLEMRTTPGGNYDLVIRYKEENVSGTIALLHQWKLNHYEPVEVLEINDHFVKKEKQDSLNKIYVDHFHWGF